LHTNEAIRRLRTKLGDSVKKDFITNTIGDGMTSDYDIPKQHIDVSCLQITIVNGASAISLVQGTDYQVNADQGFIHLSLPVPFGAVVTISGKAWALFTDCDLIRYIEDSTRQHCQGRTVKERIRTYRGFISYRDMPMELHNLPVIEEPLLIMLCTVNAFWSLASDSATDTDISTAEGTNVNRLGRYRQFMDHISDLQARYEDYCGQLNVGAFRNVTRKMRRVSYTTGRYVPIFEDREYDDSRFPVRQLPQIENNDEDNSGIFSPLWSGNGY
jgi:hypothetical protein